MWTAIRRVFSRESTARSTQSGRIRSLAPPGLTVVGSLGIGGYGHVLLVTRDTDRNQYAMKTVPADTVHDAERLKKEVDLLKILDHPRIVHMCDSAYSNLYVHIVMEYCEGGDLHNYLYNADRSPRAVPQVQSFSGSSSSPRPMP